MLGGMSLEAPGVRSAHAPSYQHALGSSPRTVRGGEGATVAPPPDSDTIKKFFLDRKEFSNISDSAKKTVYTDIYNVTKKEHSVILDDKVKTAKEEAIKGRWKGFLGWYLLGMTIGLIAGAMYQNHRDKNKIKAAQQAAVAASSTGY